MSHPCTWMHNLPWHQLLPKSGTFATFARTVPLPRHFSTYRPERASGLILTVIMMGFLSQTPDSSSILVTQLPNHELCQGQREKQSHIHIYRIWKGRKKKPEFVYQKNRHSFWNRKEPRRSWNFKDKYLWKVRERRVGITKARNDTWLPKAKQNVSSLSGVRRLGCCPLIRWEGKRLTDDIQRSQGTQCLWRNLSLRPGKWEQVMHTWGAWAGRRKTGGSWFK